MRINSGFEFQTAVLILSGMTRADLREALAPRMSDAWIDEVDAVLKNDFVTGIAKLDIDNLNRLWDWLHETESMKMVRAIPNLAAEIDALYKAARVSGGEL